MILRGMEFPLPLNIVCILIILALIVFHLFVSYKSEKKNKIGEWDRIKEFGNKINDETRKKN